MTQRKDNFNVCHPISGAFISVIETYEHHFIMLCKCVEFSTEHCISRQWSSPMLKKYHTLLGTWRGIY